MDSIQDLIQETDDDSIVIIHSISDIKLAIKDTFCNEVDPELFLRVLKTHKDIFSQQEEENIRNADKHEGALAILDQLILQEDDMKLLIEVLNDEKIGLTNLANTIKEVTGLNLTDAVPLENTTFDEVQRNLSHENETDCQNLSNSLPLENTPVAEIRGNLSPENETDNLNSSESVPPENTTVDEIQGHVSPGNETDSQNLSNSVPSENTTVDEIQGNESPGNETDNLNSSESVPPENTTVDEIQGHVSPGNETYCQNLSNSVPSENTTVDEIQGNESPGNETVPINEKLDIIGHCDKQKSKPLKPDNRIDLLLIGHTGNGKSETGNTILGKTWFHANARTVSVTREVKTGVVNFNGREIFVVDQPGVGDTAHIDDVKQAAELVLNSNKDAFALNTRGYHAFLLIVRYGGRYSKDDVECVRLLNHVFGQEFLKNYGIVIVTHGDNFKSDAENQKITFEEWCSKQEGHFKTLLDECKNRAILFDNKTKDKTVRNKQVQALLDTVDELKSDGQRYSFDRFEKYETSRQNYLIKVTEPKIRDAALNKLTLLTAEFNDLTHRKLLDDKIIEKNKTLLKKVADLRKHISDEDKESNIFADLLRNIDAFHAQIIANVYRIKELKIQMENIEKETRKRENERINFEKVIKRFAKNKQALETTYNLEKNYLEGEYRRRLGSENEETATLKESHQRNLDELKKKFKVELQKLNEKENMATISKNKEECIKILDDLKQQQKVVSHSYNELIEKQQQECTKINADLKNAKEENTKLLEQIKQKEQEQIKSLEARLEQLKKQIDDDPTSVDDEQKIALQEELDQLYKQYKNYLKVNKCAIL